MLFTFNLNISDKIKDYFHYLKEVIKLDLIQEYYLNTDCDFNIEKGKLVKTECLKEVAKPFNKFEERMDIFVFKKKYSLAELSIFYSDFKTFKKLYKNIFLTDKEKTSLMEFSIIIDKFEIFKFLYLEKVSTILAKAPKNWRTESDHKYIRYNILSYLFLSDPIIESKPLDNNIKIKYFDFMLENGFDINNITKPLYNSYSIWDASLKNNLYLVKYFIKHGFDLYYINENKENALISEVKAGTMEQSFPDCKDGIPLGEYIGDTQERFKIIKYLIQSGININQINIHGKTALDYSLGIKKFSKMFDKSLNNKDGSYNKVKGLDESIVIKYLRKHGVKRACEILKKECKEPEYDVEKLSGWNLCLYDYLHPKEWK
jgi:hypothetical protein